MEKRKKNLYAQVNRQVVRVRKLYSQIGEPLPADVLIDLYRHLGKTLEGAGEDMPCGRKTAFTKPN